MTKPYGIDGAGRPVDLIGQPLMDTSTSVPSVRITKVEDVAMAKAESNGIYTLKGGRFKINKGDVLPDGAEFTATEIIKVEPEVEERAEKQAPENKSRKAAPENRGA